MNTDSPYIVYCQRDNERASVLKAEKGYVVVCNKCHRAEYGRTLEQALKCFEAEDIEVSKGAYIDAMEYAAGAAPER